MTIPKQSDIELPLLRALHELGGSAQPRVIYPLLEARFTELTQADKAERLGSGGSRWQNRVQFARQNLVTQALIDPTERGVWTLTDLGRKRAAVPVASQPAASPVVPTDLAEVWDAYEEAQHERLKVRLLALTPTQFEAFGREFLRSYGFIDMEVTNAGADGGIDGHGRLRVGVATMRAAFQCKRWEGSVGRPEVDKFRGAIQGEFEQGVFFTTSTFTAKAQDASIKKGAVPVILFDGDQLVRIMIEKSIGIVRRPIYLFEESALPGVTEVED